MTDESTYDLELTRVFDAAPDRVDRASTVRVSLPSGTDPLGFPQAEIRPVPTQVGGLQRFAMVSEADPSIQAAFDRQFTQS